MQQPMSVTKDNALHQLVLVWRYKDVTKMCFVSAMFSVIFLLSPENLPGDFHIKVNLGDLSA
jgi:hypothetical protein